MKTPVLQTSRLTLRPASVADRDTLAALWCEHSLQRAAQGLGLWLIHQRGGQQVLGCVGLHCRGLAVATVEPLVALHTQHRGHGYAREALHALVNFAFDTLRVPALCAVSGVPHVRADRLLRSVGFVGGYEAEGEHHRLRLYRLHRLHRLHRLYRLPAQLWQGATAA